MLQVAQAGVIICKLNAGSEESTATSILDEDTEEIYNEKFALNFQTHVENPLGEIIPLHTNIASAPKIAESLN